MAKPAPKRRRTAPMRRTAGKQSARPSGDLGAEALRVIKDALGTVLTVGTEVGSAAVTTARGTVRVAGELAAGVGRVGREVAEEAVRVAGRLNAARDRVASDLGYPVPGPSGAGGASKPAHKIHAAERHATGSRKPIARSASRT